jgi:hypothetical protein
MLEVDRKRAVAAQLERFGDLEGAQRERAEAFELEGDARALRNRTDWLVSAPGGEVLIGMDVAAKPKVYDAVGHPPDVLNAQANMDRLELAGDAMVQAVDTAEGIGAQNVVEKMLAHQMAVLHELAMRLAGRAIALTRHIESAPASCDIAAQQAVSGEVARLTNATARTMATFQDAALTLAKLRNGGNQTVTVQHVTVSDGGQAIVAGNVSSPASPASGSANDSRG